MNDKIPSKDVPDGELDLRDLDLSQLRLTKKELDTLSRLTLPKKVQEQLLAQLPPQQAKKLSRTLSMQGSESNSIPKANLCKRSFSGNANGYRESDVKPDLIKDMPNSQCRNGNSLKCDSSMNKGSRSPSSNCLDSGDDLSKSFRSSYSSDTSERFKLFSSDSGNQIASTIPRYYDTLPIRNNQSVGRPPVNGCLSPPPPTSGDNSIRRRSSQRRVSRFLRPDFYDTPLEESIYLEKNPTTDSGRILKDIRERSRERSTDRLNYLADKYDKRRSCMPDIQNHQINCPQYSPELIANTLENIRIRRRSLSKSRDETEEKKSNNTDSILSELQLLSQSKSIELQQQENNNKRESDMVIKLTSQIDSVPAINDKKAKRESKLIRPKSYPNKEPEKESSLPPQKEIVNNLTELADVEAKAIRPKSFQPSKITPPKEISSKEKKSVSKSPPKTNSEETKVKIKISKKVKPDVMVDSEKRELKSPEKVAKKGFLQAISQKFEKLKEASKSKEKKQQITCDKNNNLIVNDVETELRDDKTNNNIPKQLTEKPVADQIVVQAKSTEAPKTAPNIVVTEVNDNDVSVVVVLKQKKPKLVEEIVPAAKELKLKPVAAKPEAKSKVDNAIRNLRELSVPRSAQLTESHLIKRAVSVEELPGAYNKCGVNKVLGLFKKIEKDTVNVNVQNTKSSVVIPVPPEPGKERPKSSGFVSKLKKSYPYVGAKSDSIVTITDQVRKLDKINGKVGSKIPLNMKSCPDCKKEESTANVQKREIKQSREEKDRIKNNRKGLMLDLSKQIFNDSSSAAASPASGAVNEMSTSSGSKQSNFDDCGGSTSTFMSPTDDRELYFDNWSICSEDRFNVTSPPPLPYHRPLSTSHHDDHPDNMLDRIRRKSFYTRFNERKPKRVSSIVGPGALKDYYKRPDSLSRSSSKVPEYGRTNSYGVDQVNEKPDLYRSTRMAASSRPIENGLRNGYGVSSTDYLNNNARDYHHHHLPPSTPSSSSSSSRREAELKKYSNGDVKSPRIPLTTSSSRSNTIYSIDNRSSSSIYSTYNPKRRISYGSGVATSSTVGQYGHHEIPSAAATSYATLGRKPKTYGQRTVSLMDTKPTASSSTRRDSKSGIDYAR